MFVMQHFQISWEDALHYVQNRRYCISPNSGFITQIKVRHPTHTRTRAGKFHPAERGPAYGEVVNADVFFWCDLYRNTNRYTRPALRSRSILFHRWIVRPRGGNVN